ncbi:MAG: ABC transporter related protein [Candidatus Parvarchaeum acidophilus ARMAN-5]|jgi:ABC-type multidrug transport system ATPase subunit|uniref:ABC transporter related protein n=1 Tax=Candidatus Parvarchaeum acidophilus ARMAN-5 TaxID=662762 RepID=D6GWK3_PARA5|nr:MAG: ABC transporter related protein [Candidatus Parvarchaeum acidophilus ARMAN-5]
MIHNAIVIEGLYKKFGTTVALNNISFKSVEGVNIILGPNGAGKSTFLRCIMGLYKPSSGSISVLGKRPYFDDSVREKIALLSDNYAMYDFLTVKQNLKFFGSLYHLKDKEIYKKSLAILKDMDAVKFFDRKVVELSRGTKQKIAFCRAMLNEPDILLLDEPTAFLDASSSEWIRNFVINYSKGGKTVLFVTQKLDEVSRFNARLVILREGSIVEDTTTYNIYNDIMKSSSVLIRFAKPVSTSILKLTGYKFEAMEVGSVSSVKFFIDSYADVNKLVLKLIKKKAFILGIDYIEPLVERISKGG